MLVELYIFGCFHKKVLTIMSICVIIICVQIFCSVRTCGKLIDKTEDL